MKGGNRLPTKVGQKLRWCFSGLSGEWSSSALIHWILIDKPHFCRSLSELSWPPLEQGHCYQQTLHSLVIINPFFCCFCNGACIPNAQNCSTLSKLHFWGTQNGLHESRNVFWIIIVFIKSLLAHSGDSLLKMGWNELNWIVMGCFCFDICISLYWYI